MTDRADSQSDETASYASDPFWSGRGTTPQKHPTTIGPYTISAVLGQGGMGVVYLAHQQHPERTVALKIIRYDSDQVEMRRRFQIEAEALIRLEHPGIAQVFDVGTFEGEAGPQPYLAMEHVEGTRLTSYASRRGLSVNARLALLTQVCHAVHHAHSKGIVHRDLKPGNVLVDGNGHCKVLDFGLARLTDRDSRITTLRTDVGRLLGTIPYMSPEQVSGNSADIDLRSDIYSLGVMGYELLVDRLPYDVAHCSIPQAARLIQEVDPAPLSSIHRGLRGDVQTIISKALEKEADRRYQSAAQMASDLQRFLDDRPIAARPPSTIYQIKKYARRHRGLVAGIALAFVVLVSGVIVSTTFAIGQFRARAESEQQREIAQAINDFLNKDLLSSADPKNQLDRSVTLREVLDRAAKDIGQRFPGKPLVEAGIRTTLSDTYKSLGDDTEAKVHAERALELYRKNLGPDARQTLFAMNRWGSLEKRLGNHAAAEKMLRHALQLAQDRFGQEDEVTLSIMNNLALILEREKNLGEAAAILDKVVAIRLRLLGEEHNDTLRSMNNLALVYHTMGRWRKAVELHTRELNICKRIRGPRDPETLISMNNLAIAYSDQRRYDKAETLFQETLQLRTEVLGPDHRDTLQTLDGLGSSLIALRRFAEAEKILIDLLDRSRRSLGEQHLTTLLVHDRLAFLYLNLDQLKKAELHSRTSFEARVRLLGKDHARTAESGALLSRILFRLHRLDEAEKLGLQCYKILSSKDQYPSYLLRDVARNLREIYTERGLTDEARVWADRVGAKAKQAQAESGG